MTNEEKILSAAEEEFFSKGYDAASTASIAKSVGVTHAMVNYYFRSKEKLFLKILDDQIKSIVNDLMPLMNSDGNYCSVLVNIALAVFDHMNRKRRLPFLIQDISRNHPEFLLRYKDVFNSVCMDSLKRHSERLEKAIGQGLMPACSMHGIFDNILTLSCSPFLNLDILEGVAKIPSERIDSYLESRREEIRNLVEARYRV